MIKKLLLSIGLATISLFANAQTADRYLAGSLTTPGGLIQGAGTNVFLLSTNGCNVHSVQVSGSQAGIITLYDASNTNAPFYGLFSTNRSYWTTVTTNTSTFTNIYVSPLTGTTNIFTNYAAQYTFYQTNAIATNLLPVVYALAFSANVASIQMPLNLTFAQGVVINTTTNVNYVIGYTPNSP